MNLIRYQPAVCIFLGILLFSACSEKEEFNPYLKGDIIGYAYCFDEFGNQPENFSGIEVYTLPNRRYSTVTDENGRYELKNVVNGTYDLSFEKEGFATMKLQGIKHLGGKPTVLDFYEDKTPFIFRYITTEMSDINISDDVLTANLTVSKANRPWSVNLHVYFSTEEHFAIESAQAVKNINVYDADSFYKSYTSVYSGLPFATDDKVYYKACIFTSAEDITVTLFNEYHIDGIATYFDYENNETIYPNLSDESDEFSFIMP